MVPSAYAKSVGVPECVSFAAEYPARTFPCQRIDVILTNEQRLLRKGVMVLRYAVRGRSE